MASIVHSGGLYGIEGVHVQVEVDLMRRLPCVSIVGLPGNSIRESADRIRSAMQQCNFQFPRKRVVINLAPADLRKSGASFDLPIAIAILAAEQKIEPHALKKTMLVGELSLSGTIRPIRGALSIAILAKKHGFTQLVVPSENAAEAALIKDINIIPARHLTEVVEHLASNNISAFKNRGSSFQQPTSQLDMSDIQGQTKARRALEIAAAGGHNVLMIGSPGCGKTMLASRLPTILPDLSPAEAIDITRLYSISGLHKTPGLCLQRPFRSPHHSISMAGMLGNARLLPGEASLAHNGVLFLDELNEFRRDVLESLRLPLESGELFVSRAAGTIRFPARFSLIAAANPCPCGYYNHPVKPCRCSQQALHRYRNQLSGPLIDRMDIQIWVSPPSPGSLLSTNHTENSAQIKQRVRQARKLQEQRYALLPHVHCNAHLKGNALYSCTKPKPATITLLKDLLSSYQISARGCNKLLKTARTIADLAQSSMVKPEHLLEAASLRQLPNELA